MDDKNYYILLGSIADSSHLLADNVVGWTSHKQANPDDVVFFYITAPVSGIVASGSILDKWFNEDVNSHWEGRWMSEIIVDRGISDPKPHVSMRRLRELFPEWNWLRFPRQNTQIPADIILPFLELMK